MATKPVSKSSAVSKASGTPKPAPVRLYRVWRHTAGDESAHEIAVVATSVADAEAKARAHVKSRNLGKGGRTQALSQSLTSILSVKLVGHKHCLEISTVPLAALQSIPKKSVTAAVASVAQKKAAKAAATQDKKAKSTV